MREKIVEQVWGRNFKSIGSKPITYTIQKGSNLLVGRNGAGKTTLLEMDIFIEYGVQVDKTRPIDNIVNTITGKNMLGMKKYVIKDVTSKHHGKRFIVFRGHKDKIFGVCNLFDGVDIDLESIPEFNKNKEVVDILKEYGTFTDFPTNGKEAQIEYIKEYHKVCESIYRSLVYVNGYNDDFADFKKTARKEYISNLFDINWFTDLVELAKNENKATLKKFEKIKEAYDKLVTELEVKNGEIELINKHNTEAFDIFQADKKELDELAKPITDAINGILINKTLEDLETEKELLEKNIKTIESSIQMFFELETKNKSDETLLDTKKENYESNKTRLNNLIDSLEFKIKNAKHDPSEDITSTKEKLADVSTRVTSNETLLIEINDKINHLVNTKSILETKQENINNRKKETNEKLSKFQEDKKEQEKLVDSITVVGIDSITDDITNLKIKHQELFSLMGTKENDIKTHLEVISFYENNDVCSECHQVIQEDFKQEKFELSNGNIKKLNDSIEIIKKELFDNKELITTKLKESEDIKSDNKKHDELQTKLNDIINNVTFLEKELEKLSDTSEIDTCVSEFNIEKEKLMEKAIEGYKDFGVEFITSKIAELKEEKLELTSLVSEYDINKKDYELLESELKITNTELDNLKYPTELEETLNANIKELESIDIELLKTSKTDKESELESVETVLSELNELGVRLNIEEQKLITLENTYKANLKNTDSYVDVVNGLESKISEKEDLLEDFNKETAIRDNVIDLFTSEELRASLFNHYVALLNFYADEIGLELGMDYRVQFKPDFDVDIEGYGISPDYKGMSGGQKKHINFLILATFHKLLNMFGQFKTNIIFLDEYVDGKLDVINIIDMVDVVINYFGDSSLYMVVHNDKIYDKFDRVYHVRNESKITTIDEIDVNRADLANLLNENV